MDERDIPEDVRAALERGRAAYREQRYADAEREDGEAQARAIRAGSAAGEIRATRLLGLCAYRRGALVRSAEQLEEARERARGAEWVSEELLACNHLGATYRKLGRLEAADRVFREALERANPRDFLEARARLLGNYGAFLDDLGDERAAAEMYARHEELLGLLDDPGRLANARGLVSRASRMRGDVAQAEAKAQDEIRLGGRARSPLREGRGWLHLAQARAEAGGAADADAAFRAAAALIGGSGEPRVRVELALAQGRFLLGAGRLQEADEAVSRARTAIEDLSDQEDEHRARVYTLAAEVAGAAGLHGEALWYLERALEAQLRRFEPIADPALRRLTVGRRRELLALAHRLTEEAGLVERGPDELRRVDALLARLGDPPIPHDPPLAEPMDRWRARVREEATRRWSRLLPGAFTDLSESTRSDLLLADVVAQGPVGDLSRSLFLILTTIERELRDRLLVPLRQGAALSRGGRTGSRLRRLLADDRPPGLGEMLVAFLESPSSFADDDPLRALRARLSQSTALDTFARLREGVTSVDGHALPSPHELRNRIAHGEPWAESRTAADAVRRALTLGPGAPLGRILHLRLT